MYSIAPEPKQRKGGGKGGGGATTTHKGKRGKGSTKKSDLIKNDLKQLSTFFTIEDQTGKKHITKGSIGLR